MTSLEQLYARAAEAGVQLPEVPAPQGVYLPATRHGTLVFSSGAGPLRAGVRQHLGYVGGDISIEQGQEAAQIAVLNALAATLSVAPGGITQVVRLTGFVRSAHGFGEQSQVIDAASRLLFDLLGEAGRHARSAIGVAELPHGISVEIELIVSTEATS